MTPGQAFRRCHNAISVNAHVNSLDLAEVAAHTAAPQTAAERVQKLMTAIRQPVQSWSRSPAIPLIPATWRAIVTTLVAALDGFSATFKAGKDLSVNDGTATTTMEPKLPA